MSMYFRIDLDGQNGEHLAIFADANEDLTIFQQFCIGMDGNLDDLEHCRLTTVFGPDGRPWERVDPKHGWHRISGDEWEKVTWLKLAIYERDMAIAKTLKPPCGRCLGGGKLAKGGTICPDCKGTGKLP